VIVCDIDTFGGEPTAGSIDFDSAECKSAHVFGEMVFDRHSPYATVRDRMLIRAYTSSLARLLNVFEGLDSHRLKQMVGFPHVGGKIVHYADQDEQR
jgi:hypothetical protein